MHDDEGSWKGIKVCGVILLQGVHNPRVLDFLDMIMPGPLLDTNLMITPGGIVDVGMGDDVGGGVDVSEDNQE